MLFRTIASLALLATAANAASQPYLVRAVPGQSLLRRDTNGYKPDQQKCKAGNTCAEACGAGYAQCPKAAGKPDLAHCFNLAAGESCCTDDSGNSCEAGFYCTRDAKSQTVCCPKGMDLGACAAAFGATGLVPANLPKPQTTSSTTTTTTTTTSSSTSSSTSSTTTTTSSTSSTPTTATANNTTMPCAHNTTGPGLTTGYMEVNVTALRDRTTTICNASGGQPTPWAVNSTMIRPTGGDHPLITPPANGPNPPPPTPTHSNDAAASGVSALLLVAAGLVALL